MEDNMGISPRERIYIYLYDWAWWPNQKIERESLSLPPLVFSPKSWSSPLSASSPATVFFIVDPRPANLSPCLSLSSSPVIVLSLFLLFSSMASHSRVEQPTVIMEHAPDVCDQSTPKKLGPVWFTVKHHRLQWWTREARAVAQGGGSPLSSQFWRWLLAQASSSQPPRRITVLTMALDQTLTIDPSQT